MKVLKIDRSCKDFYAYMGPVFGSRAIEQQARDRFYDDEGKVWYLIPDEGAASVKGRIIKNFWAAGPEAARELLEALIGEYDSLQGIVPNQHEKIFREMEFSCIGHRKNFLEVHYRAED